MNILKKVLLAAAITAIYNGAEAATQLSPCDISASDDDGNVPENTLDNDLGTRWSAKGDGQYLRLDLCNTYTISDVAIAWYKGNRRRASFEIQTSENGQDWETLVEGQSSGTTLDFESTGVSATSARYIQVVGYGNTSNSWNSITEIKVQGSDQEPTGVVKSYLPWYASEEVELTSYEGSNAIFSYEPSLFPEITPALISDSLLPTLDQAVANYRRYGAEEFPPYPSFWNAHPGFPGSGKASVALVPSSCGIGCGAWGRAEVTNSGKREVINETLYNWHNPNFEGDPSKATSWWIALYEIGRGTTFDFYDELEYRKDDSGNHSSRYIGNAFPELLTHLTMEDMGFSPAEIQAQTLHPILNFKEWYLDLVAQGHEYMDWHPENGDHVEIGSMGANDIMAVFMYEFYLRYGSQALENFFNVLKAINSPASTNIEAACNMSQSMDQALQQLGYGSGVASGFLTAEFAYPECD